MTLRDAGAGLEEQQPAEVASAAVSAASLCTCVLEEENLWAFPMSSLDWILIASQGLPWLSSPCLSASSASPHLLQDLSSSQSCSHPESLLSSSTSFCSKRFFFPLPVSPSRPFSQSSAFPELGSCRAWTILGFAWLEAEAV